MADQLTREVLRETERTALSVDTDGQYSLFPDKERNDEIHTSSSDAILFLDDLSVYG